MFTLVTPSRYVPCANFRLSGSRASAHAQSELMSACVDRCLPLPGSGWRPFITFRLALRTPSASLHQQPMHRPLIGLLHLSNVVINLILTTSRHASVYRCCLTRFPPSLIFLEKVEGQPCVYGRLCIYRPSSGGCRGG